MELRLCPIDSHICISVRLPVVAVQARPCARRIENRRYVKYVLQSALARPSVRTIANAFPCCVSDRNAL